MRVKFTPRRTRARATLSVRRRRDVLEIRTGGGFFPALHAVAVFSIGALGVVVVLGGFVQESPKVAVSLAIALGIGALLVGGVHVVERWVWRLDRADQVAWEEWRYAGVCLWRRRQTLEGRDKVSIVSEVLGGRRGLAQSLVGPRRRRSRPFPVHAVRVWGDHVLGWVEIAERHDEDEAAMLAETVRAFIERWDDGVDETS